ncbi:hypothetical protein [Kineococcus esterisolvens]|uniref:hypothetical protein n=1 Tax=Kineococcus sp. SYSU DK015 TaxID=3383136 RepID=UPI003D7DBF1C
MRAGALADVWVAWPEATSAATSTAGAAAGRTSARQLPEQLADAVEVVAVRQRSAALAGAAGADVEVLVPSGVLPSVLQALAVEADVVLVPVPAAAGSRR